MWKMLLGFVVFAVLAVFLLIKSGGNVDMGGEKHGIETTEEPASAASAGASAASSVVSDAASEAASASASSGY